MGLKESGLRGSLRNVSVGIDAIPDSVTDHWTSSGSGDYMINGVGDVDIDITHQGNASWDSDDDFDSYVQFDGDSDLALGDGELTNVNSNHISAGVWAKTDDASDQQGIMGVRTTSGSTNEGWDIQFWNGEIAIEFEDEGSTDRSPFYSIESDTWYLIGFSAEGEDLDIYVYDVNGQVATSSPTGENRGGISDSGLTVAMGQRSATIGGDDDIPRAVAEAFLFRDYEASEEEWDQIHDATAP